MPEQLWFTEILNHLFAGPVTGLLRAIHIEPHYPDAPIPNGVAMQLLVFAFLVGLFAVVRSRLSVERPGALQHVFEGLHGFIQGQSEDVIGHGSGEFTPFLMVLMLFILSSNLLGLIPGFESPTALAVVPLGCAICAFVYYNVQGLKHSGPAYLKHFLGPVWWLAQMIIGCRRIKKRGPDYFSRAAYICVAAAGLHFCAADDGVPVGSGGRRTLGMALVGRRSPVVSTECPRHRPDD